MSLCYDCLEGLNEDSLIILATKNSKGEDCRHKMHFSSPHPLNFISGKRIETTSTDIDNVLPREFFQIDQFSMMDFRD